MRTAVRLAVTVCVLLVAGTGVGSRLAGAATGSGRHRSSAPPRTRRRGHAPRHRR